MTPWVAAHQASLSITNSWSSPKLMSIELVMPSSHLILCHPLLLQPPIPPSIRVFSNESTLRMRWPKYWSFSFSIIPSKEDPELISFRMDWLDLLEEMQIKTAMRYITSRLPWWPSSKRTQTANIRMDVEKREPSHTVSGNINWCSHCEKQYGGFFVFVFFFLKTILLFM